MKNLTALFEVWGSLFSEIFKGIPAHAEFFASGMKVAGIVVLCCIVLYIAVAPVIMDEK